MQRQVIWHMAWVLVFTSLSFGVARAQRDERERPDGEPLSDRERDFQWQRDAQTTEPQLVPPTGIPQVTWFLGVGVNYREIGAECTTVVRRSPAGQAGLESRDLIIAVNGYQVGYVNGRLYRLERELELRADRRGRVRLLVQNHRNGELANLDIRLERAADRRLNGLERPSQLVGTVTSRRISQLPANAELVVSLIDVTDRFSSSTPIAQRTYDRLGPLPIPFELPYDPNRIDSERDYSLQADVTINGISILRTREIYPVFTGQPVGRIRMELERVR